jgi:hypothetical protein
MKDKNYYIQKYENRMVEIYNEYKNENIKDIDTFCIIHFDLTANAEEIVGYYFIHYEENPLEAWLENTKYIVMNEQDKEVTKIFNELMEVVQ